MEKPSKIKQMNANIENRDSEKIADRLQGHVATINKHMALIDDHGFEIGKELALIQEENDYGGSFEGFVKEVWGKTRGWGYQLIDGYKAKLSLPESVQHVVQNPRQALALAAAPEDRREEVVRTVAKSGKKVTAKAITEEVKRQAVDAEVIELDEVGFEIPKKILSEWNRAKTEATEMLAKLVSVRKWFKSGTSETKRDPIFRAVIRNNHKQITELEAQVNLVMPYAVCTTCDGENKKCKHCKGVGILSKYEYERVDIKTRNAREKKGVTLKSKARK